MKVRFRISQAYDRVMHEPSTEGAAVREACGRLIAELGNAENEALGIEIGYRYRNSPVICGEENEPAWRTLEYVPSTWPGARAPHLFLEDGSAIFDHLGQWFTLLRFNGASADPLVEAALKRGVPMSVVDIRDGRAREVYQRNFVLVRPDQHVAWRGDRMPAEPLAVIDTIRGAER